MNIRLRKKTFIEGKIARVERPTSKSLSFDRANSLWKGQTSYGMKPLTNRGVRSKPFVNFFFGNLYLVDSFFVFFIPHRRCFFKLAGVLLCQLHLHACFLYSTLFHSPLVLSFMHYHFLSQLT